MSDERTLTREEWKEVADYLTGNLSAAIPMLAHAAVAAEVFAGEHPFLWACRNGDVYLVPEEVPRDLVCTGKLYTLGPNDTMVEMDRKCGLPIKLLYAAPEVKDV